MTGPPTGTVTFLFTDIEGSCAWLSSSATAGAMCTPSTAGCFGESAGREFDAPGDAFFYAFPRARDGVVAAAAGQRALAPHAWPERAEVRVRMGLHTGEPSTGEEGYLGIDVARAARICSAGHGGQVLLSQTTRALIAGDEPDGVGVLDLGEHRLKDLAQPERIYQLVIAGLQTRFRPLNTLATGSAEPPIALTCRADELAAQAEAAVRDLRVSIEQRVAAQLSRAGIGADFLSPPSPTPHTSRITPFLLAGFVLVLLAVGVVFLLAR